MAAPEAVPDSAAVPASTPRITLRQPSTSPISNSSSSTTPALTPPPLVWLTGSWNVTHSSLPMWRKARNVRITYRPLPSTGSAGGRGHTAGTHMDDLVTYQGIDAKGRKSAHKVSTVRGVDKPFPVEHVSPTAPPPASPGGEELASWGYHWRGKGWLVIASSKWEILGYGEEEGEGAVGSNKWVVTYFAKTLFTPAGVDFYSAKGTLQEGTLRAIREAVKGLGGDVARLGEELFEVAYDGEEEGKE